MRTLLSLLIFLASQSHASDALKVAIYEPHFAPYLLFTKQQTDVSGIIPDLLEDFSREHELSVHYEVDSRQGGEMKLYGGQVNMMVLSKEWTKHPDKLLFSDSIMPFRDYLYVLSPDKAKLLADAQNVLRICTRVFYVYPQLEPLFQSGRALRIDGTDQESQVRMLQNNRCDFAYLNRLMLLWMVDNRFPGVRFYQVSALMADAPLQLALHPSIGHLLPALNAYLKMARNNGTVETLMDHYLSEESKTSVVEIKPVD
ncbi:transporter substrate-binding domain-containing protein [Aliiglaciecola sp. CAU 1673]|uniref:substrate-binding periplasmic protein n=1 Tax=Aliiglaciecola sp. CAU 1673 TaxID=3032595 RepID=UPI0023DC5FE3|nr:transporter substrate-binding domain-containing protein [Aliiglaciecola sp. CAU 1673]